MRYPFLHVVSVLIVFTALFSYNPSEAFLDWLWGKISEDSFDNKIVRTTGLKFEVQTTDDKFLQLKDVLENLSELDACNQIVVYKLKKRCGELTDEELGKLSVQLFNCQSAVEKRPTYTCTDGMSLAECTKGMDGTTWNGYQIVNNRARALCYATQHQQFRKLTEVTVNQLMAQAHGQLEYLQELQDGQEQLHQMTTHTVRELYESQKDLIGNQQTLKTSQDSVLSQIHSNMEELRHEKAMIATGNKELADLTENIRSKLDEATDQLQRQEDTQMKSHEKILEDLTFIQKKSHDALNKLDESSAHLVKNHEEMLNNYERMYENMMKINTTVSHLLSTVNVMQNHLDERINWFSTLLHMADDKLSILTCGALHLGYFLFAALAASFLQTPSATRVILFILVSVNASMEIQYGHSLDFASISLFLFIVCLVNWVYIWWSKRHKVTVTSESPFLPGSLTAPGRELSDDEDENQFPDTTTNAGSPADAPLSPVEMRQLTTNLGRLYNSLNESGVSGKGNSVPGGGNSAERGSNSVPRTAFAEPRPSTSAFTPYRRPEQVRADSSTAKENVAKVQRYLENLDEENSSLGGDFDSPENSRSTTRFRHSTPQRSSSRGSTSTNRSLCQGFTKAGTPCRLGCSSGSEFCYRHRGQGSSS
ncbi:protein brambleberry-like isoform X2 [Mercenaria mercenaria]|uniref:protein brambleberry-like isoform X2 n=1 Tax=Mercenaria mercenaria TaxID=6596 RepID=UPI00234F0F11|nr:protein brambleberry-like isoform X2 [Mercenaria mercenaria]